MPRLSFALAGVTLPLSVFAVPLFDVGSPGWKADLKDAIVPKDRFCKDNGASIEALLKDPAGTAYCLNVLDLPKPTHTATVYATDSQLLGVVAAATSGIGYPADPIPTSIREYPVVPIPTSVRGYPVVPMLTSTRGSSTLSTVTETDTITVDATITEVAVETETATITSTTVETLSCLTTATTIELLAGVQTGAPIPAVGIPGFSGADSTKDPEEASGYPVEVPDFGIDKRAHYGPKPACIPTVWSEKQVKQACECMSLSPPSYTTTVTRAGAAPTAVPAGAGGNPKGKSGGGLGGLLGGVLKKKNAAEDCVTETATATATRTVTQTTAASTSTVTRVETAYATGTAVAASGCAYKSFTHPFAVTADSDFGAAFFKVQPPAARGPFASSLSSASAGDGPDARVAIPGLAPFAADQAALLVQGFFLAPRTGAYTFATPGANIDNWGYLWLGETVYCDWTDDNAAFRASRLEGAATGGSKTIQLVAGEAIPVTWLWANGGGPGRSYLSVTMPDGTLVEDTTNLFLRACNEEVFQ